MNGPNPFGVRKALPVDQEPLVEFLMMHQWENAIEPMVAECVRTKTAHLMNGGGVIGVLSGDDGIEGSVGIEFDELWYSGGLRLRGRWLSVHPACRGKGHAARLLRFAQWVKAGVERIRDHDVPLYFEVWSREPMTGLAQIYRKHATAAATIYLAKPSPVPA